jgi:hypothetical protein
MDFHYNNHLKDFGIAISRIVGIYVEENVSPDNMLSKGYIFGIRDKVSPDNLLNSAYMVTVTKNQNKKAKVGRKQHEK